MPSVPQPFTLNIVIGDLINYKGVTYSITNVGVGVDNGNGEIDYAVTLSNGTIISCSAKNTINSSDQGSSAGVTTWSQSANA